VGLVFGPTSRCSFRTMKRSAKSAEGGVHISRQILDH
jgi:hypothetical protein